MRSICLVWLSVLCACIAEISAAEGSVELAARWQSSGSYTAGQTVDLALILTAKIPSDALLESGTRIYIETPTFLAWPLQSLSKNDPNFVRVTAGNSNVKTTAVRRNKVSQLPEGMPLITMVEIDETVLSGRNLTIEYRNITLPGAVQTIAFPVFLSSSASRQSLQSIPVADIRTTAGTAKKVLVSAPTLVRLDLPFDLLLQVTDANDNAVSSRSPSFEVIVDGVFARRVPAGSSSTVKVPGLSVSTPGLHRIEARSGGGGLSGLSNLILAGDNDAAEIVWADTHSHSPGESRAKASLPFSPAAEQSLVITAGVGTDTEQVPGNGLLGGAGHDAQTRGNAGYFTTEVRRPLASGGNQILVDYGGEKIQIALADTPTDHRRLDPMLPILAEIVNGRSQFEWFGNRFARFGYRVGFVATRLTHQPGEHRGSGRTAVWTTSGRNWLDAVAAGNTYAVSDGKPILMARLNGALPGSRIADSSVREMIGVVHAPYALDRIELIKNGNVVDRRFPGEVVDSNSIRLTLTSPSEPLSQWMMPRPGREWIGYLKADGASITAIKASHFNRSELNNIARNPADSGRVDFITWSHGGASSFIVDIDEGEDVSLELHIMAGSTVTGSTPMIRQFSSLNELRDGVMKRSFEAAGHTDLVELSLVSRTPISSYEFSFRDTTTPRAGDYYYLRIHGVEDQVIWSSPVFSGGFDVTSN